MKEKVTFSGKLVFVEDEKIGGFTVFNKDFPAALAEGNTKMEARVNLNKMLADISKFKKMSRGNQ